LRIIRECIKELYGQDVAEAIRIQYGGSVMLPMRQNSSYAEHRRRPCGRRKLKA